VNVYFYKFSFRRFFFVSFTVQANGVFWLAR
jgi:hypothetical protein